MRRTPRMVLGLFLAFTGCGPSGLDDLDSGMGGFISGAASTSRGDYLVYFHELNEAAEQALSQAGASARHRFPRQRVVAAAIDTTRVESLRRHPLVKNIEEDAPRQPLGQVTPYGIQLVGAPSVWPSQQPGPRAAGVCVVDSGLAASHTDFDATAVRGFPGNWSTDGCGHGTHVAGTLAALDNDRGVVGVAGRGVDVYVIKVFNDQCAWARSSDLVQAVESCRNAGMRVVNMSLGGSAPTELERVTFAEATSSATGVLIVAAAGNDGTSELEYPAAYPSVVSVGAVDRYGQVAAFSQRNSEVDLVAPGVSVYSTGSYNLSYEYRTGTSMATPHVAGVAALIWGYNPTWTPTQIRWALEASAQDLSPAGRDNASGHGLVRAKAALDLLRAGGSGAEPVASFQSSCVGRVCELESTSVDPDGRVTSVTFALAGAKFPGPSVRRSMPGPGVHTVDMVITDDRGNYAATRGAVVVLELDAPELGHYRTDGTHHVTLRWQSAQSTDVLVYRGEKLLRTGPDQGAFVDIVPAGAHGTVAYRVCAMGTRSCSNDATVYIAPIH